MLGSVFLVVIGFDVGNIVVTLKYGNCELNTREATNRG